MNEELRLIEHRDRRFPHLNLLWLSGVRADCADPALTVALIRVEVGT